MNFIEFKKALTSFELRLSFLYKKSIKIMIIRWRKMTIMNTIKSKLGHHLQPQHQYFTNLTLFNSSKWSLMGIPSLIRRVHNCFRYNRFIRDLVMERVYDFVLNQKALVSSTISLITSLDKLIKVNNTMCPSYEIFFLFIIHLFRQIIYIFQCLKKTLLN